MEAEKAPDPQRRDLVYRLLNGFIGSEADETQISRARMPIDFLVEIIYQHRLNLCGRAHLEFEDKDLEAIIAAYEQLNRLCAELMYDQG